QPRSKILPLSPYLFQFVLEPGAGCRIQVARHCHGGPPDVGLPHSPPGTRGVPPHTAADSVLSFVTGFAQCIRHGPTRGAVTVALLGPARLVALFPRFAALGTALLVVLGVG